MLLGCVWHVPLRGAGLAHREHRRSCCADPGARAGILRAGLPQLPLTTLNSVISVSQLAGELFPGRGASPAAVSIAVGLMNACGGWLGAMPCCCGAGGLAAQVMRPLHDLV